MNLQELTITDFGTYAGRQQLNLACEPGRPVVLIGGTNGAGKTTLLEAMLLCLHGRRGLWDAISLKDYHAHIASRLHQAPAVGQVAQANRAEVSLAFTHAEAGTSARFEVERSWRRSPAGRITETLAVRRDGELLDDHTGSMTQAFLDGILPPALAGLFFFDGEKIQDLADDETGRELRQAVRRLLGLDLLERLRGDLTRYAAKPRGQTRGDGARRRLEIAQEHYDASVVALDEAVTREAALTEARHKLEARIARRRERFEQEGGAIGEARLDLERRHQEAQSRADSADQELRALIAGVLPLALCPELSAAASRRLVQEAELERDEVVRDHVLDHGERLARELGNSAAASVILSVLAPAETSAPRVHDLSPTERVRVLDRLEQSREVVPGQASLLATELRQARNNLAALEEALDLVPEPSEIAPLIEELQSLGRELGMFDEQLKQAQVEIAALRHAEALARREHTGASGELLVRAQTSAQTATALRTVAALEEFETVTGRAKLEAVEMQTARLFNRLSRKRELLSSVSIDADTFAMQLRRWDGTALPKERLSAGERQLLAIALLWALRRVSGRPLPVVIDTPLARLDVEHRQRLLADYLPNASHQVVVLATDSEIDGPAADDLSSSLTRRYQLAHNVSTLSTAIRLEDEMEVAADAR